MSTLNRFIRKLFVKKYAVLLIGLIVFLLFAIPSSAYIHTVIFSDTFSNDDGTALIEHNVTWTDTEDGATIMDNRLQTTNSTSLYLNQYTDSTNQCFSFTTTFPLQSIFYLMTRYNIDSGTRYSTYLNPDDSTYGMYEVLQSGDVAYIANGLVTLPSNGEHILKQCSIGPVTSFYIDNTLVTSVTNYSNTFGTVGVIPLANSIDNAQYESISEEVTPTILPTTTPAPTQGTTESQITILSPKNNAKVRKSSLAAILTRVKPFRNIKRIEVYVNNTMQCKDARIYCLWKVPAKQNMKYTIHAKVYYKNGNTAQSTSVNVTSK